jgi:hypothetical protein
MALDPFSGQMTAAQIVATAESLANNPGKHLNAAGDEGSSIGATGEAPFDALAYMILQNHLDHLALTETFTFTRTALDITIDARINELPTINNGASIGYWRIGFSDPAWIVGTDGGRQRFYFLDAQQFHDVFQDGIIGKPIYGYVNRSAGTLTVDPAPDTAYTLELHFYPWQPGLLDIDARPWFPFPEYLVQALLYYLYYAQDDTRRNDAKQNMAIMMKQIKGGMGDERDRASMTVQLDPLVYRTPMRFN